MARPGHVTHVQFVDLPVADQDRAIAFYTKVLGLRVATDAPYREGWRWVELEIPGARTRILLSRRGPPADADAGGGSGEPAISLMVDDVDAFHAAASAAGATFLRGPAHAPWGGGLRYALMQDSEANPVLLQSR